MELKERFPYANIYGDERHQKAILGGIPNVAADIHNNLVPIDNRIIGSSGNTIYKIKQGQGKTFIQDRTTNKYFTRLETFTGERLEITLPNLPSAVPIILSDGISIQWVFPNGHKIIQAVTEKCLKETVFQKANIPILFQYKPTGLDVVKKEYTLEFYSIRTGKLVYKTERPYFEENGEMKYVKIQIQKVGDDWHVTYLTYNKDREIDPVVVFGEGGGQIGQNKDTMVRINDADASYGDSNNMNWRLQRHPLIRFDIGSHIPEHARVRSSILSVFLFQVAVADTFYVARLTTNWGITNTNAGVAANPEANGAATYDNAFDYNGVGDVAWAAGTISAADWGIAESTHVLAGGEVGNTRIDFNIPIMTQFWVNHPELNYGLAGYADGNNLNLIWSFEAVNVNVREFLTVDYDLPVSGQLNRVIQSHMALPGNLGIV